LILDSLGEGVCEMDWQGYCTFINAAGAKSLGYEARELIGEPLHDALHHHGGDGSGHPVEECPIFLATRTGASRRVENEIFWHKDGHAVAVSYSVFPVEAETGVRSVVVTFTDRTDRKRVESELRWLASELSDADRRKTEFIATLAHELRNPLAPVRTGLQLIRKAGDDAAAVASVRAMMERQVGHMVHLINDLLDIARITSGKLELDKKRVELRQIIATAVEAGAAALTKSGHRLDVELPEDSLVLEADSTRLVQVFTNLLNNAAKYTAAGGHISLKAVRLEHEVRIDVADSGIGIDEGALNSIFEMFTKVGRNAEGRQEGLGIGLNLVRRLVELHGGFVFAESGGAGHGSNFIVTLPLAPPESKAVVEPAEPARPAAPPAVPIRILLVDDNVDAATTLSMLLESDSHTTLIANSGREAIKAVAEFHPDIVFLDIGMPEMNGYEVARAIRRMPESGNPILVALTGWGGAADRLRAKDAGFDQHLTKPADIAAIEKLLTNVRRASGQAARSCA